jgi:hypothetical protein
MISKIKVAAGFADATFITCGLSLGHAASVTMLVDFAARSGGHPYAGVLADTARNRPGTTCVGGARGSGTVVAITNGGFGAAANVPKRAPLASLARGLSDRIVRTGIASGGTRHKSRIFALVSGAIRGKRSCTD